MAETAFKTAMLSPEARRILSAVCDDRLDGELSVNGGEDFDVCIRVVFEQLDDQRLELTLPGADCDPVYLSGGDVVTIRFSWHDQFYHLRARVKRRVLAASREPTSRDMLHLEKFSELKRIQRRETYRVSLLNLPPPLISFMHEGESTVCATGSLMELSESGGGTLIAEAAMPELLKSDRFHVAFELPGDDEPFLLEARLVRKGREDDDIFALVGLIWEIDGSWAEGRRVQSRVGRFIASLQRKTRR